jgi:Fe-Mn family superoxide dismutase
MAYEAKNFSTLIGITGLSETLLKNHFKLYEGYVANTNKVLDMLKNSEIGSPAYAELKRRFGWEFNGMRLHELYFSNLSKNSQAFDLNSKLGKQIILDFGSFENWEKDFKGTCALRGIGWSVLFWDHDGKKLFNCWINEHDAGPLTGCAPILVGDVFEHAFMIDYGLNRADYIATFMKIIDWRKVVERFDNA